MAAAVAGPTAGQALQVGTGPAVVLSTSAGGDPQLVFTTDDTLHMWIGTPVGRVALVGPEEAALGTGTWRLACDARAFEGSLAPTEGGLGAELPLSVVDVQADAWTWSASVESEGRELASYSAALTITLLPPHADAVASALDGEAPLEVAFADHSLGPVTSWAWDFGDGARSAEPSPTHVYSTPGTFTASLTVAGTAGTSSIELPITVREQDVAILYGMNASENVWWQRGIAFADGMARGGEFFRVVDGVIGRVAAPLIPHEDNRIGSGWPDLTLLHPGEKAGTRLFGSMGGSMPDGRTTPYVLTWEGTGSCKLSGQPVLGEANRSANRVEVFVDPTAGNGDALLVLVLDESDPSDPVRDAHVWLPGTEVERPILWQPFVDKLKAMNGGRGPVSWRAMDWNEVNQYGRADGSAPFVFDLAGRITPASPTQGSKRGVCPEYQVALCNAVGANLHFNVPHAAQQISDADYEAALRDSFLRIRDGSPAVPGINGGRPFAPLAPNLTVTVEFSNETWNPGFPVNGWLKARARDSGRTVYQETAFQIRRVFRVADEVFAGPDAKRLRKYVGGWLADPTFLLEVLAALGPGVQVDAVGPACYFGARRVDIDAWMEGASGPNCPNCPTPEGVLESARQRILELDLKLLEHQIIASSYLNPDGSTPRIELYEAGSSFVAGFQPWGGAASQAQRLPAMYDAYVRDFVPELVTRGVSVVNWYSFMSDNSPGTAGPFGHWEHMDQTITLPVPATYVDEGAPKAAAIYTLPPRRAQ